MMSATRSNRLHAMLLAALLAVLMTGCSGVTRVERDVYTLTRVDTTQTERVRNAPGERDNGIIYPSSRMIETRRQMVQMDSVVVREYPDFIRLGLFEGIGMIGSGQGGASVNLGPFGMYWDVDRFIRAIADKRRLADTLDNIFDGSVHRFGIGEWRLRWFNDAPGWSWGITGLELFRADDDNDNWLTGAGVLTVSKRFYLKESIPYGALRVSAGFAAFPSQYVHLTTSADLGSIGGLNLRAYAGYAFGMRAGQDVASFINVPYVGIGASVLDFLNRDSELEREWRDMEHSSWFIGLAELTLLGSDVESSIFDMSLTGADKPTLTGLIARLAPVTIALPALDYRLAIGTAGVSFLALGGTAFGLAVLPIRVSYVMHPFDMPLQVEPFIEASYAPSTFAHIGLRGAVPISDQASLHVQLGYVSGSTGSLRGLDASGQDVNVTAFDGFYIGIGAGFLDRFFGRDELRYARD
ncbi:MAG: hypothetical protein FGM24_01795 [Candidatus Kapabacteria bacterium]|nr:hypothetical protein [Candidatus Kapabacteria bacterium]